MPLGAFACMFDGPVRCSIKEGVNEMSLTELLGDLLWTLLSLLTT